jgi:hypothetical protein|tara:strand:+ start:1364 stop:1639 length:276 start_codon:yes stop_codon:yes gene_type:complete
VIPLVANNVQKDSSVPELVRISHGSARNAVQPCPIVKLAQINKHVLNVPTTISNFGIMVNVNVPVEIDLSLTVELVNAPVPEVITSPIKDV